MKTRFVTARILARDYRATLEFYRDTLGLPVAQMIGDENGPYCEIGLGRPQDDQGRIAIYKRELFFENVMTLSKTPTSDSIMIAVHVDDVASAVQQLEAKGLHFETPVTDRQEWAIRTAHLRDPEGNLVELFEWMVSVV
jgi:catechol 2,3-dioxygenase-like lactoylglutathione lyase family enzyme